MPMPADQPVPAARNVAGLAALGRGVCCALPVLLSLGAVITIAGVGLRNFLLAGVDLVAAFAGVGAGVAAGPPTGHDHAQP